MLDKIFGRFLEIKANMAWTIVNEVTGLKFCEDVRRTVEEARHGEVDKKPAMVGEDSEIKRFSAGVSKIFEETGREEDVVNASGSTGIGWKFAVEAVSESKGVGEIAGVHNGCHFIRLRADFFIEVAH